MTCHLCAKVALRISSGKGYCRDHQALAFADSLKNGVKNSTLARDMKEVEKTTENL